ncbi:hypothetical protein ACFWQC_27370 [Nocardioides sp. NPDC058538]|uniref:hypothetical protein n=1 Tax=Nocardioides sp. NPDC058538 TaxID=3346542 RepID=UPI00365C768E
MSDPIPRLDQFRANTPGAPMKSAAEVRRRGDQIRRRQRTLVTAGAVALAAVLAGPIIFLSAGFGDKGIDPAPAPSETPSTIIPSPSASASAPASDLTRAALPIAADLVADDPFPAWVEEQTYDGEGKGEHNECLTASLADAGALATVRRDFVPQPGDELSASAGNLKAVVAEFESPEEAEKARGELAEAAAACRGVVAPETAGSLPVEGGVVSAGNIEVVTYQPDDPEMRAVWEVATAVVSADDRVLVMTRKRGVQSYVSPTDLQTSAVNAAHRMIGAKSPVEASSNPPASSPATSKAPEPTLSARNLLTGEDAIYPNGGPLDWVESSESTKTGETAPAGNACWQSSMKARGAIATMQRDFLLVTAEGGDSDADAYLNETIAEFSSNEEAQAAYEDVLTWFDGCGPEGSDSFKPNPFENVPMAAPAEGVTGLAIYGPITAAPGTQYDPAGREEDGWFLEMGVVLSGTRIAVLSQLMSGQDYTWPAEDGGTPVQQMLPAAADRLSSR